MKFLKLISFFFSQKEPTTRPTVHEWIKCLKAILPLFKEISEINYQLDNLLTLGDETNFKPIEKLHVPCHVRPIQIRRTEKLMMLVNFKTISWPKFVLTVKYLIADNNRLSLSDHQNYETFFFRIFKNIISYSHLMSGDVRTIQNSVDMYLISRLRNVKTDLEIAKQNVRNVIPALNDQIEFVADQYLNARSEDQYKYVLEIVDEIIAKKEIFKAKWTTLSKLLQNYRESILDQLKKRKTIVDKIHHQFGGNV